jgi:hypothetical protein
MMLASSLTSGSVFTSPPLPGPSNWTPVSAHTATKSSTADDEESASPEGANAAIARAPARRLDRAASRSSPGRTATIARSMP